MKNIKLLILLSLLIFSLACDNTNSSKTDQTESSNNNNNNDDLASIKKNAQTNLDTVKDPESLPDFRRN